MATITISRQLGSLGSDVARLVAERLGYRLVWRDLINQAARLSGAPEAALAAIDELGFLDMCPSPQDCQVYRDAVKQVIDELALEGNCVILGRAGQVLLKNDPNSLHVRVIASAQVRAHRVAERRGVSFKGAQAQVHASDRYRARYLKRFYQVKWNDPGLYDLVINTDRLSPEAAAVLICQALSERSLVPPPKIAV